MKKEQILNFYEILKNVNNDLLYINLGGCGAFAFLLSQKFSNIGIQHKIVLLSDKNSINLYKVNLLKNKKISSRIKPEHVMVKVGRYYIDSEGVFTKRTLKNTKWRYCEELLVDRENIEPMIKDLRGWNPTFYVFNGKEYLEVFKKHIDRASIIFQNVKLNLT